MFPVYPSNNMKSKLLSSLSSPLLSARSQPVSRSTSRVKTVLDSSTSRVNTVLDKCTNLSRAVTTWQKEIAGNVSSSLIDYHNIKQELQANSSPPTWRDSQRYLEAKERMKQLERQKEDQRIGEQVTMLRELSCETAAVRKRVKLTFTKTEHLKGKKAKNVEKTLFLPVQMLKGFRTYRNLQHFTSPIMTKSKSHTKIDELDDYLKDEIEAFERERKRKEYEDLLIAEQRRTPTQTLTEKKAVPSFRERKEPRTSLERFLEQYGNRRLLSQVAAERRRKATERKMTAIQPSPEVQKMAQKYIKRLPKAASKPASPRRKPSKPPSPLHSRTSYSRDSSLVDELLTADAHAAHHDLRQLLHMATMVNLKNHHDRVHKGK